MPQHHVVHHGFNLLHRVRQFIKRRFHRIRNHLVLDRNRNLHEHVVLRLRLHLHLKLLHLHAHALHHRLQKRRLPVQSRPRHPRKFPQPLHNRHLRRLHREKRSQENTQHEKRNHHHDQQKECLHAPSPFPCLDPAGIAAAPTRSPSRGAACWAPACHHTSVAEHVVRQSTSAALTSAHHAIYS